MPHPTPNNYLFQSDRLGFRPWKASDEVPFGQMNSDPLVMEFFPKMLTAEENRAFVKRIMDAFAENNSCFYAVDLLETGEFIGFIGFSRPRFEADFTPCVEIGWRLKKEVWGQGLATEGAKRCLEYGFDDLGFEEVFSFTATLNKRSERIMQKIGMSKIGEFDHPKIEKGHRLERHVLYKIDLTGF